MVNLQFVFADENMHEVAMLQDVDGDIDVGETNDFEFIFSAADWKGQIEDGYYIYAPYTEYGGCAKEFESSTSKDEIYVRGYTWRGMMTKKVICPAAGEDYKVISGELNAVIKQLLGELDMPLFRASEENTGISVSRYQFDRYCTLESGLTKMLKSVGYRLLLEYIPKSYSKEGGYVLVSAVKICDHSDTVQYSQDDATMTFTATQNRRGVNHLICLGKGELSERSVIHLYVQTDGSIGQDQYYCGNEEIAEVYDYSSAESDDELYSYGVERMKAVMNSSGFETASADIDEDIPLGDTVSGQDYITGITATLPIAQKIIKIADGEVSIEYKLEGE